MGTGPIFLLSNILITEMAEEKILKTSMPCLDAAKRRHLTE